MSPPVIRFYSSVDECLTEVAVRLRLLGICPGNSGRAIFKVFSGKHPHQHKNY